MNLRIVKILLVLVIGTVILKFASKPFANSDSFIGRISNVLNKNNKLDVECNGINESDLQVFWYSEFNDQQLVIKNGTNVGKIGYEYGPNRFEIILSSGIRFKVGHFKTNNWHSHQYKIEIEKDSTGYLVRFNAHGPDHDSSENRYDLTGNPL